MKLLVLAQASAPFHGQSRAVRDLLAALAAQPGWEVHHVDLRLSRNTGDIGRWRFGKIAAVIDACLWTLATFVRHGRMPLYYVPAPGKRGALYRDWLVMALCRPFSRGLVLHWHGAGLGAWLRTRATMPERWLTGRLLGRPALSIVPTEAVREDATALASQRCVVIPNGVVPPTAARTRGQFSPGRLEVLFVGLGCAEKGLFDALEGVALAQAQGLPCRLTAVGAFADAANARRFALHPATRGGQACHRGFVSETERDELFASADVFCFPTYYPHEGQPAVLLEALAHDLPIVTTRWRGIPENLPGQHVHLVMPRDPAAIAVALAAVRREGPPGGQLSEHHRRYFTKDLHHQRVVAALQAI